MLHVCDEERCVVAHAFHDGNYTQPNEVVWLAAEIDAKLEADAELTAKWCERLERLAVYCGFRQTRIWLIAREGFSAEALAVLAARQGYGSSRSQFELLTSRLSEPTVLGEKTRADNDFEMVVPMGGDNEMIVARTVEQIARRLNFRPEAINQIKHAVVEACINASEHSFSPDQKLYQRLRVEDDKLVIIISSRGIVPGSTGGPGTTDTKTDEQSGAEAQDKVDGRRGWGLGIIRTLMDEVEFERVDDGTSLRMTKFLHR
jgi:serine/threonine-protein kinase RsbW